MAKSLLVTGAAGFIGANFVHYWMQHHPQDKVVAYDALTYAGNLANLDALQSNPNFSFVHANICDYDQVLQTLREHAVDTLVHFAAESHVDRSITGPDALACQFAGLGLLVPQRMPEERGRNPQPPKVVLLERQNGGDV